MFRKTSFAAAILAAGLLNSSVASADSFYFNFCGFAGDSSTCPTDLTEASLLFETIDGTLDVNDYKLTVTFKGSLTDTFIDAIDFEADGTFASKPDLQTAPAGTSVGDWDVFYDKVDAGAGCATDKPSHKFACAIDSAGNGPDFDGTNTWEFLIDFTGSGVLTSENKPNLRALFVDSSGDKVGAILSPSSVFETTTSGGGETTSGTPTTTGTPLPEPATLSLFGLGLVGAAYRIRRRS